MASCDSGLLDWVKALIPAISWLFVIKGWSVVIKDNDRRELRKEVRGLIDGVLDRLDKLEDQALRYYTQTDGVSGTALGALIRTALKQIGVDCKNIKDATSGEINCDQLIVKLRQAVTSNTFDGVARMQIPEDDPLFDDVRAEILALRSYLQGRFLTLYRERKH